MPVTQKLFTPGNILQGPADIYLGIAAPPSAVPPVLGTNTLTLDANGEPNDTGTAGVHVGLSDGPVVFSPTPKFEPILADQFGAPVAVAFVSLATEIDIVVKETLLQNIQKLLTSPLGAYTSVVAGTINPAADFLQFGSPRTCQAVTTTLLLVMPDRTTAGKFIYVMAYKVALKSAFPVVTMDRKKSDERKLKFYCIADPSRQPMDEVAQIVRTI